MICCSILFYCTQDIKKNKINMYTSWLRLGDLKKDSQSASKIPKDKGFFHKGD